MSNHLTKLIDATTGRTSIPLGQLNSEFIYAPYIPLMVTGDYCDDFYDHPDEIQIDVPLWFGKIQPGEFNKSVYSAFINDSDLKLRDLVNTSLLDFNKSHKKKEFILKVYTDVNTVFAMRCEFKRLYIDNIFREIVNTKWKTPLRLSFYIPKENSVPNDRLVYGGYFYATGIIDYIDYNITKIEINNIFWEDYRVNKVTEIL